MISSAKCREALSGPLSYYSLLRSLACLFAVESKDDNGHAKGEETFYSTLDRPNHDEWASLTAVSENLVIPLFLSL